MHNSLSVNINVDANLHRSQSAIKLTFSSTINGHATQPMSQQSQQMTSMGADLCKSELDSVSCASGTDPVFADTSEFSTATGDSMDNLDDLEDLTDLLNRLEENPRCFDEVPADRGPSAPSSRDVPVSGRYSVAATPAYPPVYCGTTSFQSQTSSDQAAAGPGCVGLMGNTATAPTLLGDTGPAAETLKQMAAQHQSLHENSVGRHYAYADGYHPSAAFRSPGVTTRMPRYRAVLASTGGGYMMPPAPSSMCHVDPRAAGYAPVYPDAATAGYRPVPPSSAAARFGGVSQDHCVTSSLQRLETQVRSQFAPTPVTPSPLSTDTAQQQHFRLEQNQRVDVRAPGQVVVAHQQQSFTMAADGQAQQPRQHAYASSGYPQYAGPVGYRMPFVPASGGGYGGMSGRMTQQQTAAAPPSYAAGMQSHDQDSASGPAPSGTRAHPGRSSSSSSLAAPPSTIAAAALQQLPTKIEAGMGYVPGDGAALKETPANANYKVAMTQGTKLSHPQQRPPNVTVVPGPAGAMNFHPHAGVKWIPGGGGAARHPYAGGGGYVMDHPSTGTRQSDNSGAWSLSMSQTQSLYMSHAAGADSSYHHSGSSNPAASGYPPAGTAVGALQTADPSRMQRIPPSAVGVDVSFQRNAAPPGQVYMEPYPGAYNSREYAFTDTVFVSK